MNFDPITYNETRAAREQLAAAVSSINDHTDAAVASTGGSEKVWASGAQIKQWESVISPVDGEVYRRVTATGSGTTDPADDVVNYVAVSYKRVTSLPNTVVASNNITTSNSFANGATKISLAVSINIRTLALDIQGRGSLKYLGIMKNSAGGWRAEVFLDGRLVHDQVSGSTGGDYMILVGAQGAATQGSTTTYPGYTAVPGAGVEFKRSVQVFFTALTTNASANTTLGYIVQGDH